NCINICARPDSYSSEEITRGVDRFHLLAVYRDPLDRRHADYVTGNQDQASWLVTRPGGRGRDAYVVHADRHCSRCTRRKSVAGRVRERIGADVTGGRDVTEMTIRAECERTVARCGANRGRKRVAVCV